MNKRSLSNTTVVRVRYWFLFLILFVISLTLSSYQISFAHSYIVVNSYLDVKVSNDGKCTLREAVIAANQDKRSGRDSGECAAGHGADTIILPAGVYRLSRTDNGSENASQTGDLDIAGDLVILGHEAEDTIIDGSDITDRVLHTLAGNVTIEGVTVRQGHAAGDGGAILNTAHLTLREVTLLDSVASGAGGGLATVGGSLHATAVTIADNTAVSGSGGGVVVSGGSAEFINSTISGNTAVSGSALAVQAPTTLHFVTLVGDTAVSGGVLTLDDTILAGSCTGALTSAGYNLIQDAAECAINGDTTGNILGQDPRLEPLAENDGDTPTHALMPDSPAVEAGSNAVCPPTDQRGVSRPRGEACDIGAYELKNPSQAGPTLFVNTADDRDDGVCNFTHCSFREALNLANASAVSNSISFNIPGDNPPVIYPQSSLPTVTDAVLIDGTTQPGGWVVVDGSQAGSATNGLEINAGSSTVRGLRLIHFGGSGVWIGGGGGNVIAGNELAWNGSAGVAILDSTGNQISENDIHDNGGLSIDLGGDGRSPNDPDDSDEGANLLQNFPVLLYAVPAGEGMTVAGRLNSAPGTAFTLEFFAGDACPIYGGGSQTYLGAAEAVTDDLGSAYFKADGLTAVPLNAFVYATATSEDGNTSEISDCITVSPGNTSWVTALRLDVAADMGPTAVNQYLDRSGQSRWYKFSVQPGSKIIVTLTDLPANYDLTIYKDIAQAYTDLLTPQDLPRLDAEFAPEAFSPEVFSPEVFSPEAFSPEVFSPEVFSPEVFSPEVFSPEVFSPEVFSPEVFSPEVFSADAFSPEVFSPEVFSPEVFSPEVFSPEVFSPEVFSGAQLRSLLGASAFRGTANEGIIVNTWNNTGDFYIRVRGANGASSDQFPFKVSVEMQSGGCSGVSDAAFPPGGLTPAAGSYQTVILADMARLAGTPAEKAALAAKLAEFAARPEVAGVLVDVAADGRVAAANAQADAHPACPYAKNLVAGAIKEIVTEYRALNPLAYVVIVGNDSVIPFFRYPDNALLANENNYVPPVKDGSASQASLRLGYVLGQDEYGSQTAVSFKNSVIPIPDLAVGRLVETAVQATAVLDAYLATPDGVTPLTTRPLVTGYDFLEDAALGVQTELEAGIGQSADTLIADRALAPADPAAWSADDLRDQLLSQRHDIAFLAGHFSASGALAADYTTRMTASELIAAPVDLRNALVFSAGCHSGYNVVDADGVPLVTEEPDWAQAFASKGALLIGGTGYQYGDTDFLEYSERLYLEFSRALRTGSGPVSAGQALVMAKQQYLAETPQMRGIHEKVLLQSALFGLPQLRVDMPGARLPVPSDDSAVSGVTPAATGPGSVLGLATADLTITPAFSSHTVAMENVVDGNTVTGFYLAGNNGRILTNPAEPTFPLEILNVGVPNTYLRGIGFRGGSYTDLENILPFTGGPTTEIRGVHAPFQTDVLFPVQFWRTNYFDQLRDPVDGAPRLAVVPAQFVSDGPAAQTGTMRRYDSLDFRLYYNSNVTTYTGGSQPALSAPPTIARVVSSLQPDAVRFDVDVVGNPSAGIQAVWVVYTAVSGPYAGQWQSLDLSQNEAITTRWEGVLPLNGTDPLQMRYMVQAVNGIGLTTLAANVGDLYVPGLNDESGTEATSLALVDSPTLGVYGSQVTLSALLTGPAGPVVGERVTFGLGPQSRSAYTGADGRVSARLTLLGLPGEYPVRVSYAGNTVFAPAAAAGAFTILPQDTVLTLDQPAGGYAEADELLWVTLQDADGRYLGQKTVFFVLTGPNGGHSQAVITDSAGQAVLGHVPLPPGEYAVNVYFSGTIPLHTGVVLTLADARYNPAVTGGSLSLLNHAPTAAADAYATAEDTPLSVAAPGVLANDLDADGEALTAVLQTPAAHGSVTLNSDGSFIYTPAADFYGADSFTYAASDGQTSSAAEVLLTINPVNDAPTAVADAYEVDENSVLSVAAPGVLANDTDVEGDGLTAVLDQPPAHGSLHLHADGSFTYTPDPNYVGPDSFSYRASDGALLSPAVAVAIVVNLANHNPVCGMATVDPMVLWPANKDFYTVHILGVTDPDGDTLSLVVTAVFQDEPVGQGKLAPDALGIGTAAPQIRAERDGHGDGRVYHLYFMAEDGLGGQCQGQVRVPIVPHDQAGDIDAIDGGPLYDSTQPS
ncbi:MAG: tandem-95 repeat protein [Ardenticatenaceae bacterium]|nr:tandem-95 repeat protein [Ardenticatenaceae bacterium]